ncbi:Twinfilin-1 [Cladophialophora chaetospira]|uniref:Twinfilin-1 n=1 Tax=Cladophialophora chaetospira TaxID=386627 RepID=A0AA38X5N5_9EURO|nr:Twinfilin-1 [Cladophialophora chaetospira]
MQSGITASSELQSAFTNFTSDTNLFSLPITIASESLQPLDRIPFPSPHSGLLNSIHTLSDILTPTNPLFLLLRRAPSSNELIAITYIPSRAPVRQKTLFASTRNTLMRELGNEKFSETVFLTEREEILDPAQWDERAKGSAAASGGKPAPGATRAAVDDGLLSVEERELQAVKRAEEEERHGTRGRDLMGAGGSGADFVAGQSKGRNAMKISDEAKSTLTSFKDPAASEGRLAIFSIDIPTEEIQVISTASDVQPANVADSLLQDRPSYTLYNAPGVPGTIFIYVCPGSSKIKERMIHASSRLGMTKLAGWEGVEIVKRLEAGDPEELGGGRLEEEVRALSAAAGVTGGVVGGGEDGSAPGSGTGTPRGGFARPKRPGKR